MPQPGSPLWPHAALLPFASPSLPFLMCFLIWFFFNSPFSPAVETVKIEPPLPLPPPSLPPSLLQEISKREDASGQLSCIQLPVDSSGVRTQHIPPPAVVVSLSWCLVTRRGAVLIVVAVVLLGLFCGSIFGFLVFFLLSSLLSQSWF